MSVRIEDRLVSLDAFRGFTIAGMVLVNNPGDWKQLYSQLAHAPWNGWTFTDWIFPFFLFIVGASMVFSLAHKPIGAGQGPAVVLGLWRRAAVIILIGLGLNLVPAFSLESLRVPGVLQRIGLCILIAAPLVVGFGWRVWAGAIGVLFTAYALPMLLWPVAGADGVVAAGRLEPGLDFAAHLDRWLLSGHLWAQSRTWDPEGLFSTLPAVATLLFGALAGRWLLQPLGAAEKTLWMVLAGLLLVWLGAMLDVLLMPINKPLWSVSYSVFMAGWAAVVFGAFYWFIDASGRPALMQAARRALLPFTVYGMNALFIFAFSGLVAKALGFVKLPQADGSSASLKALLFAPLRALPVEPQMASLLYALAFNLLMLAVAWFMWRRRWFVKV
ncbi:MAG: DUF1624 domain-containing protein [Rubrivivax sp.]|nr:DUF1624 domain-containing protein [Rubrivivax sp.]